MNLRKQLFTALFVMTLGATSISAQTLTKPGAAGPDEWGKNISIKTSWKEAISECKKTGKLLFIYNGWQNKNI